MGVTEEYGIGHEQGRDVHIEVENAVGTDEQGVGDDLGLLAGDAVLGDRAVAGADHQLVEVLLQDLVVRLGGHRLVGNRLTISCVASEKVNRLEEKMHGCSSQNDIMDTEVFISESLNFVISSRSFSFIPFFSTFGG